MSYLGVLTMLLWSCTWDLHIGNWDNPLPTPSSHSVFCLVSIVIDKGITFIWAAIIRSCLMLLQWVTWLNSFIRSVSACLLKGFRLWDPFTWQIHTLFKGFRLQPLAQDPLHGSFTPYLKASDYSLWDRILLHGRFIHYLKVSDYSLW